MSRGLVQGAAAILEQWTEVAPDDLQARARLVEINLRLDRVEVAKRQAAETLSVAEDPRLRAHLESLLAEIDP